MIHRVSEKLIGPSQFQRTETLWLCLDTSNVAVARGRRYAVQQTGDSKLEGWATRATVDRFSGNNLPMAGHKGYAIATDIEILLAVPAEVQTLASVVRPYQSKGDRGVEHLAID